MSMSRAVCERQRENPDHSTVVGVLKASAIYWQLSHCSRSIGSTGTA
jgi:hypothetical protein